MQAAGAEGGGEEARMQAAGKEANQEAGLIQVGGEQDDREVAGEPASEQQEVTRERKQLDRLSGEDTESYEVRLWEEQVSYPLLLICIVIPRTTSHTTVHYIIIPTPLAMYTTPITLTHLSYFSGAPHYITP